MDNATLATTVVAVVGTVGWITCEILNHVPEKYVKASSVLEFAVDVAKILRPSCKKPPQVINAV